MPSQDKQQVKEALSKGFVKASDRKDVLVRNLGKLRQILGTFRQNEHFPSLKHAARALVSSGVRAHKSNEVRLLCAVCLAEVIHLSAPKSPYSKSELKSIFALIFSELKTVGGKKVPDSFSELHYKLIETLRVAHSCLLVTELDTADEMFTELFTILFSLAATDRELRRGQDKHIASIMEYCLNEMDKIPLPLMDVIYVHVLGNNERAAQWALSLLDRCCARVEAPVTEFVAFAVLGGAPTDSRIRAPRDRRRLLAELLTHCPKLLMSVVPRLQDAMEDPNLERRLEFVEMFGDVFSTEGSTAADEFGQLLHTFLRRFNDVDVDIRLKMVEFGGRMLKVQPAFTNDIADCLRQRSRDLQEKVRLAVVQSVCEAADEFPEFVPDQLLYDVGNRARDRKPNVRRVALSLLCGLFRKHVAPFWAGGSRFPASAKKFVWIPNEVMKFAHTDQETLYHVLDLLDEVLIDVKFDVSQRTLLLLGILATMEPDVKARFLLMMSTDKKSIQDLMRSMLLCRRKIKLAADNKHELARLENKQRSLANFIAEKVPFKCGREGPVTVLLDSFANAVDNKINTLFVRLCDPTTDYKQLRSCRDSLLKALGSRSHASEYARRLSRAVMMSVAGADNAREMLEIARDEKRNKTIKNIALEVARTMSSHFPSLFRSKKAFASLEKMFGLGEDVQSTALQVLSVAADPKNGAAILDSLSPRLSVLALTGASEGETSKFAVRALFGLTGAEGRADAMGALMKKCVSGLSLTSPHLPSVLASLGQIATLTPDVFSGEVDAVVRFITGSLILYDPEEHADTSQLIRAKISGLELLVSFLVASPDDSKKEEEKSTLELMRENPAKPKLSVSRVWDCTLELFMLILHGDGSVSENTSHEDAAKLVLSAAKLLVDLCCVPRYERRMTSDFVQSMAMVAQNPEAKVRRAFLEHVWLRLKSAKLPMSYSVVMSYAAADPDTEQKKKIKHTLHLLIQRSRKQNEMRLRFSSEKEQSLSTLPEYNLVYLVHLLAHFPGFEDEETDQFPFILKFLKFYVDALLQGQDSNNFNVILALLGKIKTVEDRSAPHSANIRQVAELAQILMKRKYQGKSWGAPFPGRISLPSRLFQKPESGQPVPQKRWLSAGFQLPSDIDMDSSIASSQSIAQSSQPLSEPPVAPIDRVKVVAQPRKSSTEPKKTPESKPRIAESKQKTERKGKENMPIKQASGKKNKRAESTSKSKPNGVKPKKIVSKKSEKQVQKAKKSEKPVQTEKESGECEEEKSEKPIQNVKKSETPLSKEKKSEKQVITEEKSEERIMNEKKSEKPVLKEKKSKKRAREEEEFLEKSEPIDPSSDVEMRDESQNNMSEQTAETPTSALSASEQSSVLSAAEIASSQRWAAAREKARKRAAAREEAARAAKRRKSSESSKENLPKDSQQQDSELGGPASDKDSEISSEFAPAKKMKKSKKITKKPAKKAGKVIKSASKKVLRKGRTITKKKKTSARVLSRKRTFSSTSESPKGGKQTKLTGVFKFGKRPKSSQSTAGSSSNSAPMSSQTTSSSVIPTQSSEAPTPTLRRNASRKVRKTS
eukprot:850370_1